MAAIKGKNTKPELLVRSWLHRNGFRFRLHRKDLPGTPDIVLPKYRTVIFVHGCFWHSHGCKNSIVPKTRRAFWNKKLTGTMLRDHQIEPSTYKWIGDARLRIDVPDNNAVGPVKSAGFCIGQGAGQEGGPKGDGGVGISGDAGQGAGIVESHPGNDQ